MTYRVWRAASCCLLLLALGCGGSAASNGGMRPPGPQQVTSDRLVAKTAAMDVSVDELAPASGRVGDLVTATNGLVESSRAVGDSRIELELRVPAPALDTVLFELRTLGEVKRERVGSSDVTVQVSDLEARLTNLIAVRDRLLTYLDEAQNVEEVISVERELTRVQTEIDTITRRLELLRGQIAMSAVSLSLSKKQRLGPLGHVANGAVWVVKKLFILDQ